MRKPRDLSSGWKTYEIAQKANDGTVVHPFFEQLMVGGTVPTQPITKMRIIETLGWLEARRSLTDKNGRKVIVKKDDYVWLVKCKPGCWRLYCYVWEEGEKRYIIYVHAICKKQDEEDPSDLAAARSAIDSIRSGASGITPFEFPQG